MAYDQPYEARDGFGPMSKGMHSGLDPMYLDSFGQYAYGVNVTTRGGTLKTRPGFVDLGSVGSGSNFQGAKEYLLDESDHVAFCIDGVVYVRNGETGVVTEITGHTLSETVQNVYFTQVYRWMVVQDGVSRPLVIEESGGAFSRVARDAVVDGPVPATRQAPWIALSVGTIGAYTHGRYHFVPAKVPQELPALTTATDDDGEYYNNADAIPTASDESGKACFVSSDILDPLSPMSVFRMTEHRGLDEGGSYALPAELGFVHGMGGMRGAATGTGVGSLFVFGSRGVSAFEVSAPRSAVVAGKSWKDIAFSQTAFYGAGTYSPFSIVNVTDDLWYVDTSKHLRSVTYDRSQLSSEGYSAPAMFNITKSFECQRWVDRTSDAYRPYISAANAANRLHWTLCDGLAVGSLDFAQTYTATPSELPVLHEGIWTGFLFLRVLSLNGSLHVFVRPKAGGDVRLLRADPDAHTDPNDTDIESFIVTKLYAGIYNEVHTFSERKKLSYVELQLSGVTRTTTIRVEYRPSHYTGWAELGSYTINVPAGTSGQARSRIKFAVNPATASGCNSAIKEALHVGHAFQFRIRWTGRLKIDRFLMVAPILTKAPIEQCRTDNEDMVSYPEEDFIDLDYEVTM